MTPDGTLVSVIAVTPLAAEKLRELRAADPANAVLRLYVAGKTCCSYAYGLAFDEAAAADDSVAQPEGIPVAVDPLSEPYVRGATIDYVEAAEGSGFTVRNPSLGGSCACGRR